MKTRIFMYGEELAFSFKVEDLKNALDKLAICEMINRFYHTKCIMTTFTEEDLDHLIKEAGLIHLGIAMRDQNLMYFNAESYLEKYDEFTKVK